MSENGRGWFTWGATEMGCHYVNCQKFSTCYDVRGCTYYMNQCLEDRNSLTFHSTAINEAGKVVETSEEEFPKANSEIKGQDWDAAYRWGKALAIATTEAFAEGMKAAKEQWQEPDALDPETPIIKAGSLPLPEEHVKTSWPEEVEKTKQALLAWRDAVKAMKTVPYLLSVIIRDEDKLKVFYAVRALNDQYLLPEVKLGVAHYRERKQDRRPFPLDLREQPQIMID